jgi:O-antigen ligase
MGSLDAVRDSVFMSAFCLVYLGPLVILASRQLNFSATVSGIGCLIAGIISLVLIWGARSKQHGKAPAAIGTRLALLAIGISMFLAAVITGTIGESYYRDLPTYFALLLAGILVGHSGLVHRFLIGTVWSVLGAAMGSLALYISSPDLVTTNFSSFAGPLLHAGRLTGPFGHPNAIGSLSAIGAALSLTLISGRIKYAGYALCLITVFLSDQRSALIAVLISGVLYIAWPARHTALTWLRTSLLAILLATLLLTDIIHDNVNDILNRREASVESRQQVYDYVFSHLQQMMPIGIGVNGLYDETKGILSPEGFSHAHNAWLSFLVAGGLVGGLFFAALTIVAVFQCLRASKRGYLTPLITVVILCLVESPTYAGSNWTLISVASVSMLILASPIAPQLNSLQPSVNSAGQSPFEAVGRVG